MVLMSFSLWASIMEISSLEPFETYTVFKAAFVNIAFGCRPTLISFIFFFYKLNTETVPLLVAPVKESV
jgi:hypothetical protein